MRTLLLSLLVLALAPAALAQRAEKFDKRVKQYVVNDERTIRIDDVRIVDGTGAPARAGQSIFIRDGKIERFGATAELAGASADRVIDGKGRTLLPGLVMLHEHLFFYDAFSGDTPHYSNEPLAAPRAYLAYGATTIRTAGSINGNDDLQAARLIREGEIAGPAIHVTGPYVNGPGSFAFQLRGLTTAEETRRFVRFWSQEGATSFKIYQNVSREVLAAALAEAHRAGAKVTGHLCSITMREAASMGIDNLEHGIAEGSDFVADKQPDVCPDRNAMQDAIIAADMDGPVMKELIRTLVERKVAITSTLAVIAAGNIEWFPGADDLTFLNNGAQRWALTFLAGIHRNQQRRDKQLKLLKQEERFERAFVAAGGHLQVGTDPTGWGGTLPGPGNHAAIRLLGEAGFTPLEAIHMATMNGATYLGIQDRVGSIAEGKQADLVLVDGKPDENLEQLSRVELVFKDGIAYDPKKLTESVRGKIGR